MSRSSFGALMPNGAGATTGVGIVGGGATGAVVVVVVGHGGSVVVVVVVAAGEVVVVVVVDAPGNVVVVVVGGAHLTGGGAGVVVGADVVLGALVDVTPGPVVVAVVGTLVVLVVVVLVVVAAVVLVVVAVVVGTDDVLDSGDAVGPVVAPEVVDQVRSATATTEVVAIVLISGWCRAMVRWVVPGGSPAPATARLVHRRRGRFPERRSARRDASAPTALPARACEPCNRVGRGRRG